MYGDSLMNDRLVVLLAADNSLNTPCRQPSVRVQLFSRNGTVPCNAYSLGNIEIQNKIVVKKEIMDFNIEQIFLGVQPVMTAAKLKHNTQQLKTYCSSNDLTYMNERTTVMGYGRSEAGKVTAAYNRALKKEMLKTDLFDIDKCSDNVIIKMKGKLSDREARRWYLEQDKRIPDLIDKNLSLEEQARQACELRNKFRTQTRDLMADQEKRKQLDKDEPNKSFEELLDQKMKNKNLSREEAIKDIIKTATKTRKAVNEELGLE